MTIHKKGQAHWEGDIKRGKGTVSTESGVLNQQPYGFNTRFEGAQGTNPEELIGAAHAACFSMALSLMLGEAGLRRHPLTPPLTYRLIRWRRASPLPNCATKQSCGSRY